MNRIREKATESEAIVQNITKEIQVLDLAKKNLVASVTALKRLQLLGKRRIFNNQTVANRLEATTVSQLAILSDKKDYAEIAKTLAVRPNRVFRFHYLTWHFRLQRKSFSFSRTMAQYLGSPPLTGGFKLFKFTYEVS